MRVEAIGPAPRGGGIESHPVNIEELLGLLTGRQIDKKLTPITKSIFLRAINPVKKSLNGFTDRVITVAKNLKDSLFESKDTQRYAGEIVIATEIFEKNVTQTCPAPSAPPLYEDDSLDAIVDATKPEVDVSITGQLKDFQAKYNTYRHDALDPALRIMGNGVQLMLNAMNKDVPANTASFLDHINQLETKLNNYIANKEVRGHRVDLTRWKSMLKNQDILKHIMSLYLKPKEVQSIFFHLSEITGAINNLTNCMKPWLDLFDQTHECLMEESRTFLDSIKTKEPIVHVGIKVMMQALSAVEQDITNLIKIMKSYQVEVNVLLRKMVGEPEAFISHMHAVLVRAIDGMQHEINGKERDRGALYSKSQVAY